MGYSESIDSFATRSFTLSGLPIYVARLPSAPFASGQARQGGRGISSLFLKISS